MMHDIVFNCCLVGLEKTIETVVNIRKLITIFGRAIVSESIEYYSEDKCDAAQEKNNTNIASCDEIYTHCYREYDNQCSQVGLHENQESREYDYSQER